MAERDAGESRGLGGTPPGGGVSVTAVAGASATMAAAIAPPARDVTAGGAGGEASAADGTDDGDADGDDTLVRGATGPGARPPVPLGAAERLLLGTSGALGVLALVGIALGGATLPDAVAGTVRVALPIAAVLIVVAAFAGLAIGPRDRRIGGALLAAVSLVVAWRLLGVLGAAAGSGAGAGVGLAFWLEVVGAWLLGWAAVEQLAALEPRRGAAATLLGVAVPALFGIWLLLLWEFLTRGLGVPQVLLPAPSAIAERIVEARATLAADFRQTFLKAVLVGYAIGCAAGFLVAVAIDRSPFLKRGLLPIGNLVSALPIVGIAPIMVMWFGFDWPSKAAVVVVMTFFPMLVNTVAGLAASDAMQRDLMRTYAASYAQSLFKLRLPAALPFVFNALKINSTLALIGAIVAEFFGTPIVGMGFRISTEVGRMNIDMVWAEIAVAAVAGSAFYALVALVERAATFWHPSVRGRGAAGARA